MTLTRRILEKYLRDNPAADAELDNPVYIDNGIDSCEIIGIATATSGNDCSTTEDGTEVEPGSLTLQIRH